VFPYERPLERVRTREKKKLQRKPRSFMTRKDPVNKSTFSTPNQKGVIRWEEDGGETGRKLQDKPDNGAYLA